MLQQVSNLADGRGDSVTHCKQNSSMSSSGKAQPSQVSFKQAKRNELCEILRAEIQALQEESAGKNGVIIGLKGRVLEEQDAKKVLQEDQRRLVTEVKVLQGENKGLFFEREELNRVT